MGYEYVFTPFYNILQHSTTVQQGNIATESKHTHIYIYIGLFVWPILFQVWNYSLTLGNYSLILRNYSLTLGNYSLILGNYSLILGNYSLRLFTILFPY